MADAALLALLRADVTAFNAWRAEHPGAPVEFNGIGLAGAALAGAHLDCATLDNADLTGADLRGASLVAASAVSAGLDDAKLAGATLTNANFSDASLQRADASGVKAQSVSLRSANLSSVFLHEAQLSFADLQGANLEGAHLANANMDRASLVDARLSRVYAVGVRLRDAFLAGADLAGANLVEADLARADLRGTRLAGTSFHAANLADADLSGSDMTGACLERAQLVRTRLDGAQLRGCRIYGAATWDVSLAGAAQHELVITPDDMPEITVDSLEVAQFVYLLLNNARIREVIDTLATKAVLILGRFTPERKTVLDALRDRLRKRGYLPILFDFEKPATRNLTETVSTLGHLSRFVIADLSAARSIPQELERLVPRLPSVVFRPIIAADDEPWAMWDDFRAYPWVIEPYRYASQHSLLEQLDAEVIGPAEARLADMARR